MLTTICGWAHIYWSHDLLSANGIKVIFLMMIIKQIELIQRGWAGAWLWLFQISVKKTTS